MWQICHNIGGIRWFRRLMATRRTGESFSLIFPVWGSPRIIRPPKELFEEALFLLLWNAVEHDYHSSEPVKVIGAPLQAQLFYELNQFQQ